jgi:cysteine synthase B
MLGAAQGFGAHYETTGREILAQTDGRVTHFAAGLGTSGTFTGVGRRLREYNPDIRPVSVQPDSAFHGLEGLKHMETATIFPDGAAKYLSERFWEELD